MAYWGRLTTNGSAYPTSFQRAMGGTFLPAGATLDAVEIYCSGDGTSELRVAVYVGGAIDDPAGAVLLEDLGKITPAGSAGWVRAISVDNPSIPEGAIVWIYVHGTSSTSVIGSTNSSDAGDLFTARGRADIASSALSPDVAPPATLGAATFANFWYAFRLDYSSGPAIEITSGDLQPGGNFTIEYSGFATAPVSPVNLTDSNDNIITVAVTVDDTETGGTHSGTATGTMPNLPTGSSSVDGLLFGDVTVELTA